MSFKKFGISRKPGKCSTVNNYTEGCHSLLVFFSNFSPEQFCQQLRM